MTATHKILDAQDIQLKVTRIAFQILEECPANEEIYLLGVQGSGAELANRIKKVLERIEESPKVQIGTINIHKKEPLAESVHYTINPQLLQNKLVIVVDDVANTGKTLFYALSPLMEVQTRIVKIAVLVDRMHKTFPVHVDIVGLSLATTIQEHISVILNSEQEGAYLS